MLIFCSIINVHIIITFIITYAKFRRLELFNLPAKSNLDASPALQTVFFAFCYAL